MFSVNSLIQGGNPAVTFPMLFQCLISCSNQNNFQANPVAGELATYYTSTIAFPISITQQKLPALQGVHLWAQKDLNLRPTDYESDALTN